MLQKSDQLIRRSSCFFISDSILPLNIIAENGKSMATKSFWSAAVRSTSSLEVFQRSSVSNVIDSARRRCGGRVLVRMGVLAIRFDIK